MYAQDQKQAACMTARSASSCELMNYSNECLHAQTEAKSGFQMLQNKQILLCKLNTALSEPPGLHKAELEGSAGVAVGLQGHLWGCRGTCRITGLCEGLQGVPAGLQGYVEGCRVYLWGCRG